jgi:hypothetical protein
MERVLYKLANKPHVVQHYVATTTNGEYRHGLSNRLHNDRMVSRLWLWDRDSTHRLNLFRQRMSRLPKNQHRISPKSTHRLRPPPISEWNEVSCRGQMGSHTGSQGSNHGGPPHHGSSQLFYFHGLKLTLFTHETACIPSIWKLLVFPKIT